MKSLPVNGFREPHGHMTTAVKDTLNTIKVRTILKNQYRIGTSEIKMLDQTGPFKIELLSERRSLMGLFSQAVRPKPVNIEGLKLPPKADAWVPIAKPTNIALDVPILPPTAGLVLNPRKGSGLPVMTITAPNYNLNEANEEIFAFSVKKAVDMVTVYKQNVKEFAGHTVNMLMNERFLEFNNKQKNALKNFKSAYTKSDEEGVKRASAQMKSLNLEEDGINKTFKVDRQLARNELHAKVINIWEKIQKQEFDPNAKPPKKSKASAKAQTLARKQARANKASA